MENKEIMKQLAAKMPPEAIQRTKKSETKKGYDTDGYGYQFIADRFNEVLGDDWGFEFEIMDHSRGAYKSGQPFHDVTVSVSIWILDAKPRTCAGGHTSTTFSDALKGAITNGFKKAASFWGVGRDAYAGTIDDDNQPLPDTASNKLEPSRQRGDFQALSKALDNAKTPADIDKIEKLVALREWTAEEKEEIKGMIIARRLDFAA